MVKQKPTKKQDTSRRDVLRYAGLAGVAGATGVTGLTVGSGRAYAQPRGNGPSIADGLSPGEHSVSSFKIDYAGLEVGTPLTVEYQLVTGGGTTAATFTETHEIKEPSGTITAGGTGVTLPAGNVDFKVSVKHDSLKSTNTATSQQTTSVKPDKPDPRIYYVGGFDTSSSGIDAHYDDIYSFDPANKTFSGSSVEYGRVLVHETVVSIAGKIYVIGGEDPGFKSTGPYNSILEVDPLSGSVSEISTTLPAKYDGQELGAAVIDGKAYIFGLKDEIYEFNPDAGEMNKMDTTISTNGYDTVVAALGGKIYRFDQKDIYEYDPVSDSASKLSVTLPKSTGASAATYNGKTYHFGLGSGDDEIAEFDPASGTASLKSAKLPKKRKDGNAMEHNGKIYHFGGRAADCGYFCGEVKGRNDVYEYDPVSDSISSVSSALPNELSDGHTVKIPK